MKKTPTDIHWLRIDAQPVKAILGPSFWAFLGFWNLLQRFLPCCCRLCR